MYHRPSLHSRLSDSAARLLHSQQQEAAAASWSSSQPSTQSSGSSISSSSLGFPSLTSTAASVFVDALLTRASVDAALHDPHAVDPAREMMVALSSKFSVGGCKLSGKASTMMNASTAAASSSSIFPPSPPSSTPTFTPTPPHFPSSAPNPKPAALSRQTASPLASSAPAAIGASMNAAAAASAASTAAGISSAAAPVVPNVWSQAYQQQHQQPQQSYAPPATAASSSSFDRNRDVRDRDAILRNAEQSGYAAPKQPAYSSSSASAQNQQRPSNSTSNSNKVFSDQDGRNQWDRSSREKNEPIQRSSGYGRSLFDEDMPEGDERAPRKKARRESSVSPPPPSATSLAGASAIAGSNNPFVSGNAKLADDMTKKYGNKAAADAAIRRQREESQAASTAAAASTTAAKSLGGKRKFVSPYLKNDDGNTNNNNNSNSNSSSSSSSTAPTVSIAGHGQVTPMLAKALAGPNGREGEVHEKLRGLDPKLIESIMNEMLESPQIAWNDIAGLEFAKKSVREIVVWPILRPELFTGLRGPPKGLLLFGPPGTGKTLIGKAIASESRSRFFSISASSLTSKWHGEGEKLVRTLFAVAQVYEPSIIFIGWCGGASARVYDNEIDSLLSQRQESEFEASRRIKTEMLVQLDGCGSGGGRVLLVGATNRPQELDEAARRRLVKRLYVPLPDYASRMQLMRITMAKPGVEHHLTEADLVSIVNQASGYSGSDMAALCREAAMGPIREVSSMMGSVDDLANIDASQVRPIQMIDFDAAFRAVRPSVNQRDLEAYVKWNDEYGSFPLQPTDHQPAAALTSSASAILESKHEP